jgi:hypothetical protein
VFGEPSAKIVEKSKPKKVHISVIVAMFLDVINA